MATEGDHASDPSSGPDDLGATGDSPDAESATGHPRGANETGAPAAVDGPATTRSADAREHGPADPDADALVVERGDDQRVPTWLDTSVQYTWRGIVLLAGLALLIVAMTRLYLVTLPVIIALILSTLCVPPARRLERAGWPKIAAAGLVVVGGAGSFFGLIALLTPAFVSQIQELGPTVAEGFNQLVLWLEEGPIGYDREQLDELLATAVDAVSGAAGTIAAQLGTLAVAVVEGLTALALALVLLFFFVKDGEQLVAWFLKMTPVAHRDDIRAAGQRGWVALSGFVRGTSLVALIDAVGIGIGLLILDVPLVLPLSVLVFFGGFVPVIGAFVTGLLAVLVALADQGLQTAVIMALIVLAVQQIESNLLQPTIMKRAVSLHPVVILGVLTAGAVLIGIVGAFLAVPVTAVLAAVGNELRIRHELRDRGHYLGPTPAGGPGVDPETLKAQFPEETQLRAAARRGDAADTEGPARRRRSGRRRIRVKVDDEGETVARTTSGTISATPDDGTRSTDDPDPAGTRTEGS
ncbi:MAG: AI-2E family transporter [Nitriliruptor sp.]|nr:MAG: AI-2E family transporter [Nitriliruptor sp.]